MSKEQKDILYNAFRSIIKALSPKWEMRTELMGGRYYWMIYRKQLGFSSFYERCNTPETARIRLGELKKQIKP